MKKLINSYYNFVSKLTDLPLLIFRAVLVYGFYSPALYKVKDFGATAAYFDSLGIPMPTLNAYLAGLTEMGGVILLTLGLGTRIIAIPMIIVMLVAIKTVHLEHGFAAINNGYEIPLYFIFMLITLMVYGPGKLSVDHFLSKRKKN